MASSYASNHPQQIEGLLLLAAYPYKSYPEEKTLVIYGSLNTSVAQKVQQTTNVFVIDGGNHAQFGDYGKQFLDATASISANEQQQLASKKMLEFLDSH